MKTKEEMIEEIIDIMHYTPTNQLNTVYLGSMAVARIFHMVGVKYPEWKKLRPAFENCDQETLLEVYDYTEHYRKYRDIQEREDDEAAIKRLESRGWKVVKE